MLGVLEVALVVAANLCNKQRTGSTSPGARAALVERAPQLRDRREGRQTGEPRIDRPRRLQILGRKRVDRHFVSAEDLREREFDCLSEIGRELGEGPALADRGQSSGCEREHGTAERVAPLDRADAQASGGAGRRGLSHGGYRTAREERAVGREQQHLFPASLRGKPDHRFADTVGCVH